MSTSKSPRLQTSTSTVCGWPSDSFSVDYYVPHPNKQDEVIPDAPHTVILFVPGNPGLIEWYLSFFLQLVQRLGQGFAARGVAHAGHSLKPERVLVAPAWQYTAWTVEGQSLHKAAYVDVVIREFQNLSQLLHGIKRTSQFIFVCHSIGTFFAQQLLMRRADILVRTKLLIGLMPFIRMDAPWGKQCLLDTLAARPDAVIRVHERLSFLLSQLPRICTDVLMRYSIPDPTARSIAMELIRIPHFVKNFFKLGLEEIRDVPETVNVGPLRRCPTALLLAGNDHWSPEYHLEELQRLRERNILPKSVTWEYNERLRHDFVVDNEQVEVALVFCEKHIRHAIQRSKL